MIHGIDHTALSVPDFDRALEFYCGVLGFEVEMNAGWPKGAKPLDKLVGLEDSASKVAMIALGDTRIELFQYQSPLGKPQDPNRPVNDHGITHICLRVSEIGKEVERLREAGVRFHSDPIPMGKQTSVYGRDPFGNVLELIENH
jgi:catechol 2,3-dioxygenase-like lactoylglutathione lyase family enzyme